MIIFYLFIKMSFEIIQEFELSILTIKTLDWCKAKKEIINNLNNIQFNLLIDYRELCISNKDLEIEIKNSIFHLLPQFFIQINYNTYEIRDEYNITIEEINKIAKKAIIIINRKIKK